MKRADWIKPRKPITGLIHFSEKKLTKLRSRNQVDELAMKPCGLWVSDESDFGWKEWCKGEGFALERLRYPHAVEFVEDANILNITTLKQLDSFGRKYAFNQKLRGMMSFNLDWKRLAKDYHGVFITPYQWRRRLDMKTTWYYGWDCASGCIWNKKAIKSIELIE